MQWADGVAVEKIGGVPFRMYAHRPKRVEDLLAFADRWGSRPHIVQGQRTVSFTQLRQASLAKAAQLAELGVGRGDHVLIHEPCTSLDTGPQPVRRHERQSLNERALCVRVAVRAARPLQSCPRQRDHLACPRRSSVIHTPDLTKLIE